VRLHPRASGARRPAAVYRQAMSDGLELAREPVITTLPLLPEHRVLRVHVRNDGLEPLELRRALTRLLDEHGEDLRAAVRPPIVRLRPGEFAALDLVYRGRPGCGRPAALEHAGVVALDLTAFVPR